MKFIKLICWLGVLGSAVVGCGSGTSAEDAAVNADISKPGDKLPPGLDQSAGAGSPGTPTTPTATQTGP